MLVLCSVEYSDLENEEGREVPGVRVTCNECGNSEESYGEGDNSVRRCLALLSEGCDSLERNFYEAE